MTVYSTLSSKDNAPGENKLLNLLEQSPSLNKMNNITDQGEQILTE